MLRRALAELVSDGEDVNAVTVAALTERAGLTRRTFYTHYRDIPDFIEQVEANILDEIRARIARVAAADLASLYRNIEDLEPAPGSVELLAYLKRDGAVIGALLGPGGDPAFVQRIMDIARDTVADRMKTGIFPGVLGGNGHRTEVVREGAARDPRNDGAHHDGRGVRAPGRPLWQAD